MKSFLPLVIATLCAACVLLLASCGYTLSMETAADSTASGKAGQTKSSTGAPSASSSRVCVTVINVGKGDCILLQMDGASALIDTGYENTAADVLACLRNKGVDRLDAMIITHYDRDHVEGMCAIGEGVEVDTIYLPGYEGADKNYRTCVASAEALGVPVRRVTEELDLSIGSARLTVFPSGVSYKPGSGKEEGNDNDMSLVATLTYGRDSYLFAGDLEEEGIDAYLAADHGQFDVLKMPHHGQRSSNITEFLDDVRPRIAVITDAEKDKADKKTLKALKSAGVETYRTSEDGTIVIESDGNGKYSLG